MCPDVPSGTPQGDHWGTLEMPRCGQTPKFGTPPLERPVLRWPPAPFSPTSGVTGFPNIKRPQMPRGIWGTPRAIWGPSTLFRAPNVHELLLISWVGAALLSGMAQSQSCKKAMATYQTTAGSWFGSSTSCISADNIAQATCLHEPNVLAEEQRKTASPTAW